MGSDTGSGMGPDFTTAVLEFDNRVIARLTCGLCAPRDRSLTVMGEAGTLTVADLWDYRSPILLEKPGDTPSLLFRLARRFEAVRGRVLGTMPAAGRELRYANPRQRLKLPPYPSRIDFAAGLG